jgi:hypothetical protein
LYEFSILTQNQNQKTKKPKNQKTKKPKNQKTKKPKTKNKTKPKTNNKNEIKSQLFFSLQIIIKFVVKCCFVAPLV